MPDPEQTPIVEGSILDHELAKISQAIGSVVVVALLCKVLRGGQRDKPVNAGEMAVDLPGDKMYVQVSTRPRKRVEWTIALEEA